MSDQQGRRKHQKSRKGCRECKRRRVKCDERVPSCSACTRLELRCSNEQIQATLPDNILTPLGSKGLPRPHTQAQWDTEDLELLHHYSICGCIYVPGEHRRRLWTCEMVQCAFRQEYLLYQLLAVSALHCYSQNPSRSGLAAKAARYRCEALRLINPTLANMSTETCIPVFAFAGASMVYAFGELAILQRGGDQHHDPISHVTDCLRQNYGINTIVQTYKTEIEKSWASELINMNSDDEFDKILSSGLGFAHTERLFELFDAYDRQPEWIAACRDALDTLLQTIQILLWRPEDHFTFHLINAWPSSLRSHFWLSLEAKDPTALIVLAYLAVLMSLRPKLWWFHDWPKLLLNEIEERLDPCWQEALVWPRDFVFNQSSCT